jgi:hypothetical protein
VLSFEKKSASLCEKKKRRRRVFLIQKRKKKGRVLWRTRKEQLILFVFDSLGIS